jgi:hypothetical protein
MSTSKGHSPPLWGIGYAQGEAVLATGASASASDSEDDYDDGSPASQLPHVVDIDPTLETVATRAELLLSLGTLHDFDLATFFTDPAFKGFEQDAPDELAAGQLEWLTFVHDHVLLEEEVGLNSLPFIDSAWLDRFRTAVDEFKVHRCAERLLQAAGGAIITELLTLNAKDLTSLLGDGALRACLRHCKRERQCLREWEQEHIDAALPNEHYVPTPRTRVLIKSTTLPVKLGVYHKFQGGFVGNFADVKSFHGGLRGLLGRALQPEMFDAMEKEHCAKQHGFGASRTVFTTTNYGGNETTPINEWLHVVDPEHAPPLPKGMDQNGRDLGTREKIPWQEFRSGMIEKLQHSFTEIGWSMEKVQSMTEDKLMATIGDLEDGEIIALRMYTGPCFILYNTVRQSRDAIRMHPFTFY